MSEQSSVVRGHGNAKHIRARDRRREVRSACLLEGLESRRLLSAGQLDAAFGYGGKVITATPTDYSWVHGEGPIRSIFVQPDGTLLAIGGAPDDRVVVGRYNEDGALDTTFHHQGFDVFLTAGSAGPVHAAAAKGDGKYAIVEENGWDGNRNFMVIEYDAQKDVYGEDSYKALTTDFAGRDDDPYGVTYDAQGRIIVVGRTAGGLSGSDFAIARYKWGEYEDWGSTVYGLMLDTDFANGGKRTTDFAGGEDAACSVVTDDAGHIIVAGQATIAGDVNVGLARYNDDGSLDTSFGSGGKVNINFGAGSSDYTQRLVMDSSGRLLVAGFRRRNGNEDFILARLRPNGSLDTTFGNGGKVITSLTSGDDWATSLVLDSSGGILLAGCASNDFALARYTADGELDSSFGSGGFVRTDFNKGKNDRAWDLAIDSRGRIILAGSSNSVSADGDYDFAMARYKGSPVNHAPTDVQLSASAIAEHRPVGTIIGALSTTDPDADDTFTYSLVPGEGGSDNALFSVSGNKLKTAANLSYETRDSYTIRVRSKDSGGLSTEQTFTISVTDVNETPAAMQLSGAGVAENEPAGTLIGTLSTTDLDGADTHSYTLVSGSGSTDNGLFAIVGDQLQTTVALDYETKKTCSIRVRTIDAGGLSYEKVFAIAVGNVNEAPTDLALSTAIVVPQTPAGTTVGRLFVTDPDGPTPFTWSIVDGIGDGASFALAGDQLQTAALLDGAVGSDYTLRVRVIDAGGLAFEKDLTIAVQAPATISGMIFKDANADGLRSRSDAVFTGQRVFLDINNNGRVDLGEPSQQTNAQGRYSFTGIVPGQQHVRVVPGKGWRISGPALGWDLALTAGAVLTSKDIGLTQMARVTGTVFNDLNGNKLRSATERGIAGWTVFADKDGDGVLDKGEISATTDKLGNFSLNLPAGTYTLRAVARAGFKSTTPSGGKCTARLQPARAVTSPLFGFKR